MKLKFFSSRVYDKFNTIDIHGSAAILSNNFSELVEETLLIWKAYADANTMTAKAFNEYLNNDQHFVFKIKKVGAREGLNGDEFKTCTYASVGSGSMFEMFLVTGLPSSKDQYFNSIAEFNEWVDTSPFSMTVYKIVE